MVWLRIYQSLLFLLLVWCGSLINISHAALLSTYISVGVSGTGGMNCQRGEGAIVPSVSAANWQVIPTTYTKAALNTGDVLMRRQLTVVYPYYTVIGLQINLSNPLLVAQLPPISVVATGWYQSTTMSALNPSYAQLTLNGQNRAVALRTFLSSTASYITQTPMQPYGPSQSIISLAPGTTSFVPNSFTATWTQEIILDDKNVYDGGAPLSTGSIILAYADNLAITLGPTVLGLVNAVNLFCYPSIPHPSSGVGLLTPYGAPAPILPPFTIPGCTVTADTPSIVNLDPSNSVAIANLAVNQAANTAKNFNISLNCERNASVKMAFTDMNYPAGGNNYLRNNALGSGSPTMANGVGVQVQYLGSPNATLIFSNDSTANNINTVTGTIITPIIPPGIYAAGGRIDLPFSARYFRYASGISTGEVVSEMNILFFYN